MNAILEANPTLNMALVRLKDGTGSKSDFTAYVAAMQSFHARAVADGLGGVGELGTRARGVALCYADILRMIEDAAMPSGQEASPAAPEPMP